MGTIKYIVIIFLLFTRICNAQRNTSTKTNTNEGKTRFGIKAGYNYFNLTNVSLINGSSQPGFHVGIFGASVSDNTITESGELLFSKVGYSYQSNTTIGNVNLYYLSTMELANIKLGEQFALQVGVQLGYLLNAKADSNKTNLPALSQYNRTTDYYNRIDYGFAGGIEINPATGFIIGARYTISINKLNKSLPNVSLIPPFIPSQPNDNLSNNLLLLYAGYRF